LSSKGEIRALLAAPLRLRVVELVYKIVPQSFADVSIPIPAFVCDSLQ
jgi:hypothetical protein